MAPAEIAKMAETVEETYETEVRRKVVRRSMKIEEVSQKTLFCVKHYSARGVYTPRENITPGDEDDIILNLCSRRANIEWF